MPDDLLTVTEVASKLKITRTTVNQWFQKGYFPNAFQAGNVIRIPRADLEAVKKQPFKEVV